MRECFPLHIFQYFSVYINLTEVYPFYSSFVISQINSKKTKFIQLKTHSKFCLLIDYLDYHILGGLFKLQEAHTHRSL